MYENEIIIPAAFYDLCLEHDIPVPQDLEIRSKGKGRQYVINKKDLNLSELVHRAEIAVSDKTHAYSHARSLLLALRKQGVKTEVAPTSTAKPVTRKVAAHATGRDYNRELVVTITPRGDLILRPAGRRQSETVALSDVYAWAQRNRCLRIAREKAALKAAKRKSRK
jgi:beta-phosphoglucomutase-like phosphatase (HAD superfamily)